MKISIFGLGYVGAVSLACLSRDGHQVIGVDIDRSKLDLIASGKTPVVEEGMVDLMREVAASGRVSVTTNTEQAVLDSELSLVCVGTPSAANGSQDQGAILALAAAMGRALREKRTPHVVVFRSTLVPGTVETCCGPSSKRPRAKRRCRLPPVLPARVPARRHLHPRLRQAALHHPGRQPRISR
jgi:GDP-mannose 6-dehydrogenase